MVPVGPPHCVRSAADGSWSVTFGPPVQQLPVASSWRLPLLGTPCPPKPRPLPKSQPCAMSPCAPVPSMLGENATWPLHSARVTGALALPPKIEVDTETVCGVAHAGP